jgi:hypothetical protein
MNRASALKNRASPPASRANPPMNCANPPTNCANALAICASPTTICSNPSTICASPPMNCANALTICASPATSCASPPTNCANPQVPARRQRLAARRRRLTAGWQPLASAISAASSGVSLNTRTMAADDSRSARIPSGLSAVGRWRPLGQPPISSSVAGRAQHGSCPRAVSASIKVSLSALTLVSVAIPGLLARSASVGARRRDRAAIDEGTPRPSCLHTTATSPCFRDYRQQQVFPECRHRHARTRAAALWIQFLGFTPFLADTRDSKTAQ